MHPVSRQNLLQSSTTATLTTSHTNNDGIRKSTLVLSRIGVVEGYQQLRSPTRRLLLRRIRLTLLHIRRCLTKATHGIGDT